MKQIHFIAQGKGGVGKSFIAALLAQYLHNNTEEEIHCYDTDPVNQTFSRYKSLNVELIHILNEHNNIDSRKFDGLIESLIEKDGIAVIDNGAATFIPLMSYMNENNVIEILQDSGASIFFHVPIQGGQALEDTMLGLSSIIDRLPVQVMVWLNHHKGEIMIDGKKFNEFRVYENNRNRIAAIIELSNYNPDTYGKDIQTMTEHHLTFAEVQQSTLFHLMPKQRLINVWRDISNQLLNINELAYE